MDSEHGVLMLSLRMEYEVSRYLDGLVPREPSVRGMDQIK